MEIELFAERGPDEQKGATQAVITARIIDLGHDRDRRHGHGDDTDVVVPRRAECSETHGVVHFDRGRCSLRAPSAELIPLAEAVGLTVDGVTIPRAAPCCWLDSPACQPRRATRPLLRTTRPARIRDPSGQITSPLDSDRNR
jgi:hypothetical protein